MRSVGVVSNINHSVYLARALDRVEVLRRYDGPVIWTGVPRRLGQIAPMLLTRSYPEAAGLHIRRQVAVEITGRAISRFTSDYLLAAGRRAAAYDKLVTRRAREGVKSCVVMHWHTNGLTNFARAARESSRLLIADHRDIHPAAHDYADPLLQGLEAEFALADFIVLNSSLAASSFIERGYDPKKLVVVPLGATADESLEAAESIDFLFVGSVSERKGVDVLLNAVRQSSAEINVTVVGAIEDQRIASELSKLSNTTYLGVQSRARVHQLMRSAKALVLPSRLDSYGLVAAESIVNGTPVLVTDTCGIADDVRRTGVGHVVPSGSAAALAEAMSSVVNNASTAASLQKNCASQMSYFSWQGYEDRIIDFYNDKVIPAV